MRRRWTQSNLHEGAKYDRKELIQATYRFEATPRSPWVPYEGIRAGRIKGYTAAEILKDADRPYECLMEVHRLYQPDGQPIDFDLLLDGSAIPTRLVSPNDGHIALILEQSIGVNSRVK